MTPTTLQALRRLLFFTHAEACALIAASPERPQGVQERTWRMWEAGDREIPDDIEDRLYELADWREAAIEAANDAIDARDADEVAEEVRLTYYETMADWLSLAGREPILWRPHCSAMAELVARHGAVLIPFDPAAYRAWLGKRTDSEVMRARWAGAQ